MANSTAVLFTFGPQAIPAGATFTVPAGETATLNANGDVFAANLTPFIGSGNLPNYLQTANGNSNSNVTGVSNFTNH